MFQMFQLLLVFENGKIIIYVLHTYILNKYIYLNLYCGNWKYVYRQEIASANGFHGIFKCFAIFFYYFATPT